MNIEKYVRIWSMVWFAYGWEKDRIFNKWFGTTNYPCGIDEAGYQLAHTQKLISDRLKLVKFHLKWKAKNFNLKV